MICSFKEREVHFKCNVFEGILELKRCISTVNTWNFTLLFFLLFFNFKLLKVFIFNSKNFLKNFNFFTLEIYVLIFSISVKLLTLETHVCLYFANFNFFFKFKISKNFTLEIHVSLISQNFYTWKLCLDFWFSHKIAFTWNTCLSLFSQLFLFF